MSNDRMIAALLRERDGCQRRGLDDRVAQIDDQLAFHGYVPEDESDPAADAVTEEPAGRTADSGQQTTAAPTPAAKGARGRGRGRPAQG